MVICEQEATQMLYIIFVYIVVNMYKGCTSFFSFFLLSPYFSSD